MRILIILIMILNVFASCKERNKITKSNDRKTAVSRNNLTDQNYVSIHQAAKDGDVTVLKLLIGSGVKVDSADQDGRSALMYASYYGHTEAMKYLLANGAQINMTDINGSTPLMMASSGPYPEAVKLLLRNQADPNIADREAKYTALMYAASEGQLDVVRILLINNADPLKKNVEGNDALTFAVQNNHPQVVALLKTFIGKQPEH